MASTSPEAMLAMMGNMGSQMPPVSGDMQVPGMPQIDPAMAQAYVQMFQYLQQGLSQQALGSPGGNMGMPPMPFPGMPTPYAPSLPVDPSIAVSVEGMKFQYQLTEDDLHKVFSRYGPVRSIRVDEAGASAVITFNSFPDAQGAMTDLNGKVLNGLEGTLRIQWTGTGPSIAPPYPSMPFSNWGFSPGGGGSPGWPANTPPAPPSGSAQGGGGGNSSPKVAERSPHTKGVRKYTCRFLIGIENDKEFQVARRIIGAKGANMKRIVRQTEAKLRLRGMGSGYFEGSGQKESSEPLQLCVSCTSAEGYKTAVRQVEELLKRVYEEYKLFCRDSGHTPPALEINLTENQLVYSSRTPAAALAGSSVEADHGTQGMYEAGSSGGGSPKKDGRRGRRSRAKREGRNADGEMDRGEPGPNAPPVEEIEKLIDERNEARRANSFSEADRIRELLHSRGVALMDEPGGRGRGVEVTTWRYWRD
mmetsp:Transcript_41425/g.79371  ORF Transcript_41425/g.79371 Transcript_41425/m.79371 type:complete len:475 (-) Transcript_41425:71-1495(-)